MEKYFVTNYSVGSIIERTNYARNVHPKRVGCSLLERKYKGKRELLWQRIKKLFSK